MVSLPRLLYVTAGLTDSPLPIIGWLDWLDPQWLINYFTSVQGHMSNALKSFPPHFLSYSQSKCGVLGARQLCQ